MPPLDDAGQTAGPEQEKKITEKQFLRAWRERATNRQEINDSKEAAAAARAIKRGIVQRLEGFGFPKTAFKIFEQLFELEEDERLRVIESIVQAGIWTKTQLWRPGDNQRPQGVLFSSLADQPDPELEQERVSTAETLIKTDAWNTAKANGETSDNPHPPGSREHQVWAQEFGRYQQEHQGNAEQQKSAARKRRADRSPKTNGAADRSDAAKRATATRRSRKGGGGEQDDRQPA